MIKVSHESTLVGKALSRLLRNDFWQTQIDDEGIKVTRWLGKPITIPWESITCIDISGLAPGMNSLNSSRLFFLLIIDDRRLVVKACTLSSQRKTWYAASNVLGLTNICKSTALEIQTKLRQIAQNRLIKIDTICLPS